MPQSSKYCPTQSEFEAFPPTLQRKCFSTLERLRYAEAQAQADSEPKSDNIGRTLSRKLITSRSIYRLRQSKHFSGHDQSSSRPVSRPGSIYTSANVTPEDALWFSGLPDKIKRGYFSIEEEKLLIAKKQELVSNALEQNIYELDQASNHSVPSLQQPSSCLSSIDDSTAYSFDSEDDEDDDMDIELMSTLSCLDTDLDLSLDDYRQILTETRSTHTPIPQSFSVYDSKSSPAIEQSISSCDIDKQSDQGYPHTLKPIRKRQIDEWETRWGPDNIPPVPPVPETATLQTLLARKASVVSVINTSPRKASRNLDSPASSFKEDQSPIIKSEKKPTPIWIPGPVSLPTPPMTPPLPLLESQATHYLDPEARLKLRMYLASASKFDEALEFGFPSLPSTDKNNTTSFRPVTAATNSHLSANQQRQNRPTTSIVRRPVASASVTASPVSASATDSPQSEFFAVPYNSLSNDHSVATQERKTEVQAQLRKLDRDLHGCASGREMTIRMTLTRPELRADETLLYPTTQNLPSATSYASDDDLLVLQDLKLDNETKLVTSGNEKLSSLRRFWSRRQL